MKSPEVFNTPVLFPGKICVVCCLLLMTIFGCKETYKSRNVGKLVNGQREGSWEIYDENNVLRQKNNYHNDTLDGAQVTYDAKGKIYTKALYRKGIFTDSFRMYFDNGQIQFENWFDSLGRGQGIYKSYYKDGHLKAVGKSLNGMDVDTLRGYDEDGRLLYFEIFKSGTKDRSITYLNEMGLPLRTEYYHGDQLYKQTGPDGR